MKLISFEPRYIVLDNGLFKPYVRLKKLAGCTQINQTIGVTGYAVSKRKALQMARAYGNQCRRNFEVNGQHCHLPR